MRIMTVKRRSTLRVISCSTPSLSSVAICVRSASDAWSSSSIVPGGSIAAQDVATSITPGSATAAAKRFSKASAGHPVAGLADAEQDQLLWIHIRALMQPVDNRRDDGFPVGPEIELLPPQRGVLSRTIEDE